MSIDNEWTRLIAELRSELRATEIIARNESKRAVKAEQQRDELQAKCDELVAGIAKYGRHGSLCRYTEGTGPCNCWIAKAQAQGVQS